MLYTGKKILSLVVIVAFVLTASIGVFAAGSTDTLSKELGLSGSEGVKDTVSKLEGAKSALTFKGLYDNATGYTGKTTFNDTKNLKGNDFKVCAYLKNNRSYGFGADSKGNFNPSKVLNSNEVYSIILMALGYKIDFNDSGATSKAKSLKFNVIDNDNSVTWADYSKALSKALSVKTTDNKTTLADKLAKDSNIDDSALLDAGVIKSNVAGGKIKPSKSKTTTPKSITFTLAATDKNGKEINADVDTEIEWTVTKKSDGTVKVDGKVIGSKYSKTEVIKKGKGSESIAISSDDIGSVSVTAKIAGKTVSTSVEWE